MSAGDVQLVGQDLSRTVSELEGDFSRKSQNFPTPSIYAPMAGFSLELGIVARVIKTRTIGLSGGRTSFKIDLAV